MKRGWYYDLIFLADNSESEKAINGIRKENGMTFQIFSQIMHEGKLMVDARESSAAMTIIAALPAAIADEKQSALQAFWSGEIVCSEQ